MDGGGTGGGVPGVGVRVPAFDGIRGIAILSVIVFHSLLVGNVSSFDKGIGRFAGMGWLGVDLFFVLSGFLITGILVDTKGGDGFFKNFYARRTLRIFPLFYLMVILAAVVAPVLYQLSPFQNASLENYTDDLWSAKFWLLTYTHNYLQAT